MELAVNIPEQDPQVGHAFCSMSRSFSSDIFPAWKAPTPSKTDVNVSGSPVDYVPPSIGPPDTKMEGTLVLNAAINIPGVILSQFGI